MPSEILVFSEDLELLNQLIAGAHELATANDWGVVAYCLDSHDVAGSSVAAPAVAQALTEAAVEAEARLVLIGATRLGMEVSPRIAERWAAGYGAWALNAKVEPSTGRLSASCMLYAGTGVAEYEFLSDRVVLSVGHGVFDPGDDGVRLSPQVLEPPFASCPVTIVGAKAKPASSEDVEHSSFVVDCGKGVATAEDLEQARLLASLLAGQVACSRPLAADRGWFSDWLGLSGMRVKPQLCVTLGISGSVQHLIGIRDASLIVAVNQDKDAPIFDQADFGVVGDLREFLPAFIQRVKERGVRPNWLGAGTEPVSSPEPVVGKEV